MAKWSYYGFFQIKLLLFNMWFCFQDYHMLLFGLITGFSPINSWYLNCWNHGQLCDEIRVIIIKEWHIFYLFTLSGYWSSIWTIEKLPKGQNQKLLWLQKGSTLLLSCFKIEQLYRHSKQMSISACRLNSLIKSLFFGYLFKSCLVSGFFFILKQYSQLFNL